MATTYTRIAPPDVTIIVETPVEPVTITPAVLSPCIVGPCYEIIEILNSDGSTNDDARVSLPASVTSQELTLTATLALGAVPDYTMSVDGGPDYDVKLSTIATPTLPADVVSYFNNTLAIPGLTAEILPGATGKGYIHLRTAAGEGKTIAQEGVDAAITALLGGEFHDIDKEGSDDYNQWFQDLTPQNFPNPHSLDTDELVYDPDDILVYMDIGSTLAEMHDDSAIERYGTAQMEFVDDGDGDGMSPILRLYSTKAGGPNALPQSTAASAQRSTALNATESVCQYDAAGAGGFPLTADGVLRLSIDGSQVQEIELEAATHTSMALVVAEINKYFSWAAGVDVGPGTLRLVSYLKGSEGCIYIDPGSTASILTDLQITAGYYFGTWFPAKKTDTLYINGESYGTISKVFPSVSGPPDYTDIKLGSEYPESTFATPATQQFYLRSENLPAALPDVANTEPTPELYKDSDGDIHIKHNILRDVYGVPMFPGAGLVYLGYKALRKDLSADAETPRLVSISQESDIEAELGEIRVDNPLAFGAWLTKVLACPDKVLYCLGIGETSDDLPDGTLTAYTSAFSYLENWEIYGLATLTQEVLVHQAGKTHVDTQSNQTNKAERKYFGTLQIPTRAPDTVAISGTEGVTTAVTNEINLNVPGLTQALVTLGVDITNLDPSASVDAEEVFIDIEQDAYNYRVKSISGQLVTIIPATGSPSWNADGFYATSWPYGALNPLINESWSMKVRGAELVTSAGAPDKEAIARAVADICKGFGDWRVHMGFPGNCTLSDPNGLENLLPTYYLACITVGQFAQNAPQQPYTNMQVPGVLGVTGSTDYFNKDQLNIIAGGGAWIWFQETPSAAVQVRHQLSTDTSTKIKMEASILNAIDYAAKFVRTNVRPLLGRFNITPELEEQIGMTIDGCCTYLHEDLKVFNNCTYSDLQVVDVDEIEVAMDLDIKYPLNKVTVRFRI